MLHFSGKDTSIAASMVLPSRWGARVAYRQSYDPSLRKKWRFFNREIIRPLNERAHFGLYVGME